MPLSTITLSTVAASLALVTGLILLAARLVRGLGWARLAEPKGREHRLVIKDSLTLDRVRRLIVVRCDGRDMLLLTGGSADLVVGWLPEPSEAATRAEA